MKHHPLLPYLAQSEVKFKGSFNTKLYSCDFDYIPFIVKRETYQ